MAKNKTILSLASLGVIALAGSASAALDLGIQLRGSSDNIEVTTVGQVVTLDIYALYRTGTTANSGSIGGGFGAKSSTGGLQVDITGTRDANFSFNPGSSDGTSQDLDADGDKDLGATAQNLVAGMFAPVSGIAPVYKGVTSGVSGYAIEERLGQFNVQVKSLSFDGTTISLYPRNFNGGYKYYLAGVSKSINLYTSSLGGTATTQLFAGPTIYSAHVANTQNYTVSGTKTYAGARQIDGGGTMSIPGGATANFPGGLTVLGGLSLRGIATGALNVGFGGVVSGDGTAGSITLAGGGELQPGLSPGQFNADSATWGPGGTYHWEINKANGGAGGNWDLLNVTGALDITATSGNPFVIQLNSLKLADNTPGAMDSFALSHLPGYTWKIAQAGSVNGFSADKFVFQDEAGFRAANGIPALIGPAQVLADATGVYVFQPVPLPSTLSMGVMGLISLGGMGLRRRRSSK